MARANHNASLEYAPNKVEFWMYDEDNVPIDFDGVLTYSISRIDDDTKTYSTTATPVGNYVVFNINPTKAVLSVPGDCLYSYDEPVYEHIFSVRSATTVYISGKLNMLQVG